MKKTKRVEITAKIMIDVEVDEDAGNVRKQALKGARAWCDRNLDWNDSIQIEDCNAAIYPDYVNKESDEDTVTILWDSPDFSEKEKRQ